MFKRLLGRGDEPAVPEWAGFFSPVEYNAFLEVVASDFRRRGLSFEIGDGVVYVNDGGEKPTENGLSNLAQYCAAIDRSEWPARVAGHFDSLRAIVGRDLDALAADFEQVRPIIRVRLMPDETMGGVERHPDVSARRVVSGVLAVLVYDFPDSTASVPAEHVVGWPIDMDEAFDIATANVRSEPAPAVERLDLDGAALNAMSGDSFYIATRALFLGELLGDDRHGVFAIPNRHLLLWHPARDLSIVNAMLPMYQVAVGQFREGPGSISDQLYWWRDGEIVHLPHASGARGRTAFTPPEAFVEFLNDLTQQQPG